jgi:hypothetical protein
VIALLRPISGLVKSGLFRVQGCMLTADGQPLRLFLLLPAVSKSEHHGRHAVGYQPAIPGRSANPSLAVREARFESQLKGRKTFIAVFPSHGSCEERALGGPPNRSCLGASNPDCPVSCVG